MRIADSRTIMTCDLWVTNIEKNRAITSRIGTFKQLGGLMTCTSVITTQHAIACGNRYTSTQALLCGGFADWRLDYSHDPWYGSGGLDGADNLESKFTANSTPGASLTSAFANPDSTLCLQSQVVCSLPRAPQRDTGPASLQAYSFTRANRTWAQVPQRKLPQRKHDPE